MPCWKKGSDETLRVVKANNLELAGSFVSNKISNTKYTLLTFLPLNLYEQFSRFMNIYFLIIACLQLWAAITPVNPLTTWLPLIMIFTVSAIKEGLDDYFRYKSDKAANGKPVQVSRDGVLTEIRAMDVVVGDIVYIVEDESVCADMVLLKSSAEGAAYIETANLDGETDLKTRTCLAATQELTDEEILNFEGVCQCAAPNPHIYKFDSNLRLTDTEDAEVLSLSVKQTILQGTNLRNTEWAYGLVVYTGNETKIGKNKRQPPTKWTKLDKLINKTTVAIFTLQLCFIIAFGIAGNIWRADTGEKSEYLLMSKKEWYDPIVIPLRFMLLMSFMIPISLKVTMDMVKFYYAQMINWDQLMYDPDTDTPAEAKNTAISEDLGQLEFIFSDKTGTITENIMRFQKCAVNGIIYGHSADCHDAILDERLHQAVAVPDNRIEREFFLCLALNQTVVPNAQRDSNGKVTYKSSSPDEEALVLAAQEFGITFTTRDAENLQVNLLGDVKHYELLNVLEFSSDRKRMSVIIRDQEEGKIKLYMKGADDKVIARLDPAYNPDLDSLNHQLETFAELGLRTLVIGYRYLDDDHYNQWMERWHEANTSIENREELLFALYEEMEQGLELLGVTAIEDKLQEEVPETIALLRKAGLKFWMLTGDKYATALQIAGSCNLMSDHGVLLPIVGETPEEIGAVLREQDRRSQELEARGSEITVIIEGTPLAICLQHHKDLFRELGMRSHAVVCCRVTPQQKALVVRMVKEVDKMCLSIGDGGNDVTMIQEAHVGVGISGREGLQAARAADYAISKFKFLGRLMMVHGRYSYYRTTFVAQYSFFKSIYIAMTQLIFNLYAGLSGVSLYGTYALTLFNAYFTGAPVFGYALDKDVTEDLAFAFPAIYGGGQRSIRMNPITMAVWFCHALYHAFTTLLIAVAVFNVEHAHWGNGSPADYTELSLVAYTSVIIINQAVMLMYTNYLTLVNFILLSGSIISYFGLTLVYCEISTFDMYTVLQRLMTDGNYWATVLLTCVVALLPGVVSKYVQITYFPTLTDQIRSAGRSRSEPADIVVERMAMNRV